TPETHTLSLHDALPIFTGGSSGGPAMPQHIGNATYSLSIATPAASSSNGAGGFCAIATGSGAITAADGSTIFFLTVGLLCNESRSEEHTSELQSRFDLV